MAVLKQLTTATIALLVGFALFSDQRWSIYEILQAALSLIVIIIVFNQFLPFVFFSRTNGAWLIRWTWLLTHPDLPGAAGDDRSGLLAIGGIAHQGKHARGAGNRSRGRGCVDRSRPGRRHYSGRRPRPDPVGGGIQRQDRARSHEAASGDVRRARRKPRSSSSSKCCAPSTIRACRFTTESIHNIKGIVYAQDVLQVPDSEASHAHSRNAHAPRCLFCAREQAGQRSAARNAEEQYSHGHCGR